jgi:hypothetical protein
MSIILHLVMRSLSERIVLTHYTGTRHGCVPSGEVVGGSPSLFPHNAKRVRDPRS